MKSWQQAMQDSVVSGGISSVMSTAALAACGARETGSVFAPTNAVSHWVWGDSAARHDEANTRHTVLGYAIHHFAATFWAVFYEKWFGELAERQAAGPALTGGMAVAALACFVDYKMTPHRLQPGYEQRLSKKSLFLVYAATGLGFCLRGLLSGQRNRTQD